MGLIGKAMVLSGGYFIAKKLMDKNDKKNGSNKNNNNNDNHARDQQDDYTYNNNNNHYNNNQNRSQQDNFQDQNRSQQDQRDFIPAPVYRDTQPQIQYGEQQRQMSSAVNGERYYADEKVRAEARKSFD